MASSVAGILGSAADGESFTGQAHRLGMASHATIVNDGAGPLTSRSGIIPGAGTPLAVTALGTPAMKVLVQPGTCAIQSTSVSGGVHTVTLTTATNLDITAAHATNPRIDLVVAKVFADGTATTNCTIEVITGTASASPVRPSIASPPTNTHYLPLSQVRVDAAVATIVAAKVTKVSGTDGLWTVAPGGVVPVDTYTQAAGLPLYTPFYSINDAARGHVTPAGATIVGPLVRYWAGVITTNGSGDCSVDFGVRLAAGLTAAPFPSGILVAVATDAQAFASPTVVIPRWTSDTSTAATATFRIFDVAGNTINSSSFAFAMIAVGY